MAPNLKRSDLVYSLKNKMQNKQYPDRYKVPSSEMSSLKIMIRQASDTLIFIVSVIYTVTLSIFLIFLIFFSFFFQEKK